MLVEEIIQELTQNPLFLQLKTVVENAEGWHDYEDVYSHLVKTARLAKENITGIFIKNDTIQQLFNDYMQKRIFGTPRGDILQIAALIHDCGKILMYQENNTIRPLVLKRPHEETLCPGHEYWGSVVVAQKLLKNVPWHNKTKLYIRNIIRLHGVFNNPFYFLNKQDWLIEDTIIDIKSQAEGLYIEALYNAYCDGYDALAFAKAKKYIETIFSTPSLYIPRKYLILQPT